MPEHFALSGPAENGIYSQAVVVGNFYLALNFSGDLEAGHNILKKIEEIVGQSPQTDPQELLTILPDLNLVAAKIIDNKLTVAAAGEVSAKLIRKGKTINLLGKSSKISGQINQDDVLVLGTKDFFDNLFTPDIFAVRDDLPPKLEELSSRAKVAALVLKIHTETNQPIEKPSLPKMFLRHHIDFHLHAPQSRRSFYALLIVFVVIISSLAFQLRGRTLEERARIASEIEKQATDNVDAAGKLAGLNNNIARDILLTAKKDLLSRAQTAFGEKWQAENSPETKKLKATLDNLNQKLASASHIYTLSGLDTFSDFSLLRAGVNVSSAVLNHNEIRVLDGANGAVYSLTTKNKTAAIIGGGDDFKNNGQVDFTDKLTYVWTNNGIYTISDGTAKLLVKPSDKWGQIKGLRTFSGNLYLLDTKNSQIWKYQGTDIGLMDIAPYLRAGSVDFSQVNSFTIDGSILVLSDTGNVVSFTGGNPDDFALSGLDTPLKHPTSIFSTDETKNIYILDSGNNRVVVVNKKGVYQAQYTLPLTLNPSPLLLADEAVYKVFLLSGSKVYSFDLR